MEGKTDEFRFASVRPLFSHTIYLAYCAGGERERKEEEEEEATSFPSSTRDFSFLDPIVSRRLLEKRTKNVIRFPIFSCFTFPQFSRTKTGQVCACTFFSIFSRYFPLRLPTAAAAAFGGGGGRKRKKSRLDREKVFRKRRGERVQQGLLLSLLYPWRVGGPPFDVYCRFLSPPSTQQKKFFFRFPAVILRSRTFFNLVQF